MNKLLIMCEGQNEKEIINILLDNDLLKFTQDDLLGLTPYHARQIKNNAQVKIELNMYPGKVDILRIGDKQSDKLVIPQEYKDKIGTIKKYCTKPELEILLILAFNLEKEYEKVKSKMKAKDFAKNNIIINKKHYNNSTSFYAEFFGNNSNLLIKCLKDYKQYNGSHLKDEHYLEELLK